MIRICINRSIPFVVFLSILVINIYAGDEQIKPVAFTECPTSQLIKLGDDLYSNKQYKQVVDICQEILKREPDSKTAKELLKNATEAIIDEERKADERSEEFSRQHAISEVTKTATVPEELPPAPRPVIEVSREMPEKESELVKKVLDTPISVDLIDAPLDFVLSAVFKGSGLNIVANQDELEGRRLTIYVQKFPLRNILEFIGRNEGISFTIKNNAVWVTTPKKPFLVTKIYPLIKGLTNVTAKVDVPDLSSSLGGAGSTGGAGLLAAASAIPNAAGTEELTSDIEKLLQKLPSLIDWPEGSEYYLDRKENMLILRSSPEALTQAEQLITVVDASPQQVLIETRFIEISDEDLADIGVELKSTSTHALKGEDGEEEIRLDDNSGFSFSVPSATEGLDILLTGVVSDPQYKAILHALATKKSSNTLSAPRIIALNNSTSYIEVLKEIVYVSNATVDWQETTYIVEGGTTSQSNSTPVVVPTFDMVNTGFTLEVTPSIGRDRKEITLLLKPTITDLLSMRSVNILAPGVGSDTAQVPIEKPSLSIRTVRVTMTVTDGSTVIMGGLIKEDDTVEIKKVPILGDIPILKYLFRYKNDTKTKTNLLIFVTAHIISPEGRRYTDNLPPEVWNIDGAPIKRGGVGQLPSEKQE